MTTERNRLGPLALLWRQFIIEWKLYGRDRHALFWSFAFPILTLVGLGTIFRSGSTPALTLVRVPPAVESPRDRALLEALGETRLQVVTLDAATALARWERGETSAQLEPDAASGYRLRLNSYLMFQAQSAAQEVNLAFLVAQSRLAGAPEPERVPTVVESPGHTRTGNYAAFLLPGLLGLNLVSMGLFSVGMVNVAYREKGKFRRLAVTPLPKWIFLLGQVAHRVSLTALQAATILIVGFVAFGIANQGSYLLLAAVLVLGTGAFMAIGFALASFAETTEAYGPLSNLLFLPMMFLSGVYFTLESAPPWLQRAVFVLPLSPFVKALRAIFNDGAGLAGHGAGLTVVAIWGIAAFAIAVRRFRWA